MIETSWKIDFLQTISPIQHISLYIIYIYIYIYIYICILCIYTTYIEIYLLYIHIFTVYIIYIYIYICVCIYMCVCIHTHTHTHTQTHIYIYHGGHSSKNFKFQGILQQKFRRLMQKNRNGLTFQGNLRRNLNISSWQIIFLRSHGEFNNDKLPLVYHLNNSTEIIQISAYQKLAQIVFTVLFFKYQIYIADYWNSTTQNLKRFYFSNRRKPKKINKK